MTVERSAIPAGGRMAVSIVSYRTASLVLSALPALLSELESVGGGVVFVVDNASPDDDGAALEAGVAAMDAGGVVRVIRSPVNGGFAAGNNLAFAAIRALPSAPEAVLMLNPDAAMRAGALTEMLAVLRARPRAGFVGPRLEHPEGGSWVGAFHFPTMATEVFGALGIGAIARRFPRLLDDVEVPTRADWVTGTATLIRWEALVELGDMDDGYFLYYEEVDYMLRGAQSGWESWHAPAARVLHDAGAATGVQNGQARTGRTPPYVFQAWGRYFAKNHGAGYARLTAAAKIVALTLARLHTTLRGKSMILSEGYLTDFARQVLLARLSPPPRSALATHRDEVDDDI